MRRLGRPVIDDHGVLDEVADHHSLSGCAHLQSDRREVKHRYDQYLRVAGDAAASGAPTPVVLRGLLQKALLRRYESTAAMYNYIDVIRQAQETDSCPMCGAPNLRTVDHIFPRAKFPEFAIFSANLVPACPGCNSPRQDSYLGASPGERVLHPYFDAFLDERLITAELTSVQGSYRRAKITAKVKLHAMHPFFPVMRFHLREVVLKSGILDELGKLWVRFQRKPQVYFQSLPPGAFTIEDLSASVNKALLLSDEEFSTPNNWKSFLLSGLAEDLGAKTHLAATITAIRAGNLDPRDI